MNVCHTNPYFMSVTLYLCARIPCSPYICFAVIQNYGFHKYSDFVQCLDSLQLPELLGGWQLGRLSIIVCPGDTVTLDTGCECICKFRGLCTMISIKQNMGHAGYEY